jgi:Arc/MetJ-type ribon-helix-helix transcriptional regulator
MSDSTQVAFQVENDRLAEIDNMVATHRYRSRAEALRAAVAEFVGRRREEEIDAQLAAGYALHPPGAEEEAWADASADGFAAAKLDW